MTASLRLRRRLDDPGRIGAGTGSQDGANRVHGVLDARFAVDGKPSLQRDLAVITGPASADHDRIVVRRVYQGRFKFIPGHVVVTDRGHDEAVATGQFDGQLAEPGASEVLEVLLVATEVFHRRPDLIRRPAEKPLMR